jgi:hypothetical protein
LRNKNPREDIVLLTLYHCIILASLHVYLSIFVLKNSKTQENEKKHSRKLNFPKRNPFIRKNLDFRQETLFKLFLNKCFNPSKHIYTFSKRLKNTKTNSNLFAIWLLTLKLFFKEFRRESSLWSRILKFPITLRQWKMLILFHVGELVAYSLIISEWEPFPIVKQRSIFSMFVVDQKEFKT